ncbi:MAG: SDR family oxidoreductase [Candidatus Eremiobacteraeota bacterium]|nr:SDR family oxidoreductase [Candidatus Eremiobacteraeota bacterium]
MNLQDKVAVVTGAATGIGRAIATQFVRDGAKVVIDYVGPSDKADDLAHALDTVGSAVAVAADVSDEQQVDMLVQHAVKTFGRLDVFVNNAGIEQKHPFLETPTEYWHKVVAVNLTGPFLCSRRAAKQMVDQGGGGRIINISSVHEDITMPGNAAYCATKGGLRMLTRTIAVELAPHGITVNNVAPGAVDTPMDADLKRDRSEMERLLNEIPLHRMAQPQEIAALCAFLASDQAAYVTGATYVIDGGLMRKSGSL